jgi:hypothetical protein
MKHIVLAVFAFTLIGGAAKAGHGVIPDEAPAVPYEAPYESAAAQGYRETCEQMDWSFDGVRTECRYETLPVRRANPALKGICTIYYGNRTCY